MDSAYIAASAEKRCGMYVRATRSPAPRVQPSLRAHVNARRATSIACCGLAVAFWPIRACAATDRESTSRLDASHTWTQMAWAAASTFPILNHTFAVSGSDILKQLWQDLSCCKAAVEHKVWQNSCSRTATRMRPAQCNTKLVWNAPGNSRRCESKAA
jgi:hypothetical protein